VNKFVVFTLIIT